MGIKGLETFLYQMENGIYEESIAELAEKYRRNAGLPDTEHVKIVVDTNTCQQVTFEFTGQFVGYEVQGYVNRVRVFVDEFKKLGIEPVFFFSDLMIDEEECQGNIANVRKVFEYLVTQKRLPDLYHLVLPASRFTSACILQYVLGCEVKYVTTKSSRETILEYIQENQCFAILTTNTEFIACQIDAIVLSSNFTMCSNMRTLYYDRIALARELGIRIQELPLLAIMAGRDNVTSVEIENFHDKCLGQHPSSSVAEKPISDLIKGMAAVIRHQLRKLEHIEDILNKLGLQIMGPKAWRIDLFKKSYYSYFLPNTYRSITQSLTYHPWSLFLIKVENHYRRCKISTDVYTVLTKQMLYDILTFDDLRESPAHDNATLTRDQPSFTVLRPLRRRLYGILLFEKESSVFEPVNTVREWKYEAENRYMPPMCIVCPINKPEGNRLILFGPYPAFKWLRTSRMRFYKTVSIFMFVIVLHPGLMALWYELNDNINRVRWTLFLKTISPSLDVARWKSLDEELLLPTLSVYHLYDIKYLNESEVDAVLVTIATCGLPVEVLPHCNFDIRVGNISIALYRTFTLVLNILAACGYPVQLSENNAYLKFESRLFQFNYAATMEKKADTRTLCQNHDYFYYKFKRMKDIINETENDKLSDDLAQMEV